MVSQVAALSSRSTRLCSPSTHLGSSKKHPMFSYTVLLMLPWHAAQPSGRPITGGPSVFGGVGASESHTLREARMCFSHTSLNSAPVASSMLSLLQFYCYQQGWHFQFSTNRLMQTEICLASLTHMFRLMFECLIWGCLRLTGLCLTDVCSNVQGDSQTSICITIEPGLLLKGDILVRMNLRKHVKSLIHFI